jgi:hypothetical protein
MSTLAFGLIPSAPASAFSPDEFFEPTPRATGEAGLCPTGGQGFSATFSNPAFLAIETGNKVTGSANTFFRAKTKITFPADQASKFEVGTSSFSGSLGGTNNLSQFFAASDFRPSIGYGLYTPTNIEQDESRKIRLTNNEVGGDLSIRAKANFVEHKFGTGLGIALTKDFLLGMSLIGSRTQSSELTSIITEAQFVSNKNKQYLSSIDRRTGLYYRAGAILGLGYFLTPNVVLGVSSELTVPLSFDTSRELDEMQIVTDPQDKPLPQSDPTQEIRPIRKVTRTSDRTASVRNYPQKIRAGIAVDLDSVQLAANLHFRSDFVTPRGVTTRWELDPHLIVRLLPGPTGHGFSLGIRRTGRVSAETYQFWELAAGATHAISEESEVAYGIRYLYGKKVAESATTVNEGILVSVGLSSRI